MKKIFLLISIFAVFFLLLTAACQKEIKPVLKSQTNNSPEIVSVPEVQTNLLKIPEPAPEVEKKIHIAINFDGNWRKNTSKAKAIIIIKGKSGKIIGQNGGEIPITVKYLDEKTIKITEGNYNPKYLSNWFPENIAQQIYLNELLKNTFSVLRIIDNNTLIGTANTWQVLHSEGVVQKIEPFVAAEEWKRIEEGTK